MPRDYKNRANSHGSRNRGLPGWAWFISGLLVGLFFSGLAWLKLLPAPDGSGVTPQAYQQSPDRSADARTDPRKAPPKPRFDFYTILPEMEVVVPEPESEETPRPPVTAAEQLPEVSPQAPGKYMLQMGSFRNYADADRLKASLALVGIEAEIQWVKIGRGEVYHRVRAGPYSPEKVKLLSGRLKENDISSLVIKLK